MLVVDGGAATAVDDPAGTLLAAGPFSLANSATATLSYQVRVNDDAYEATLTNAVTGTGTVPPAQCVEAKPCTTTDIVPPKPTPTETPTPMVTETPAVTPTPTVTETPTVTPTPNPTEAPKETPEPTATATETKVPTSIAPATTEGAATTAPVAGPASNTATASAPNNDLAVTGAGNSLPLLMGGLFLAGGALMLLVRRVRRTH